MTIRRRNGCQTLHELRECLYAVIHGASLIVSQANLLLHTVEVDFSLPPAAPPVPPSASRSCTSHRPYDGGTARRSRKCSSCARYAARDITGIGLNRYAVGQPSFRAGASSARTTLKPHRHSFMSFFAKSRRRCLQPIPFRKGAFHDPLRQRMTEDMQVRNLSPHTQACEQNEKLVSKAECCKSGCRLRGCNRAS
jgi:hypothetical protein